MDSVLKLIVIKGGVLISEVDLYIYVAGTVDSVLIKGGVLISGVDLYICVV